MCIRVSNNTLSFRLRCCFCYVSLPRLLLISKIISCYQKIIKKFKFSLTCFPSSSVFHSVTQFNFVTFLQFGIIFSCSTVLTPSVQDFFGNCRSTVFQLLYVVIFMSILHFVNGTISHSISVTSPQT